MAATEETKSVSPEPTTVSDSKKRKSQVEEIEVDLSLPEPPSKKAKRLLKKGKPLPVKPSSDDEGDKNEDGLNIPSTKGKDGKDKASKRSEFGIWIGNLPFTLTRVELFKWFVESSGGVIQEENITRVNLPKSKFGQGQGDEEKKFQNKGFAYVDFDTQAAAMAAMSLTETQLDGRNVLIKNATNFDGRPQKEAEADGAAAQTVNGRPVKQTENSRKIYVGNLPFQATEDDIWAHFEKCGVIDWVKVATFEDTGKCKGYGWVKFKEVESAESAVKGFVRIKEEIETEDDFRETKDEDAEPAEEKKFKMRKWWVNRIRGRDLKIEFAEDDQVRYKKRFGKDKPPRPEQNGDGHAQEKAHAKPAVVPKKTTFED